MDPKEGFYQTAAAIFLALFIGGLVVEGARARAAASSVRSSRKPPARRRAIATLALVAVILVGELGALFDLLEGPAPEWVQWGVIGCLLASFLGVTGLGLDVIFAEADLKLRRFAAAALIILCVGYAAVRVVLVGKAYVSPLSGPYRVGGTCADLDCGLRQHVAPTTESPFSPKLLQDGSLVHIKCQTLGAPVRLKRGGAESSIWGLLSSGYYISDLFVNTTRYGTFDPVIPRCPGSPTAPDVGREPVR
jgi:hypothetical protein